MRKTIIISSLIALATFLGGYFLGQSNLLDWRWLNNKSQTDSNHSTKNVKIISLSGTVMAIDGNKITLKVKESDERIVEFDGQTKVYIQEYKSSEQYQKEMEEYLKKTKEQPSSWSGLADPSMTPVTPGLAPEVFAKKAGTLSDIKIGAALSVASNDDIKEAKRFRAVQIIIPPPVTMPEIQKVK